MLRELYAKVFIEQGSDLNHRPDYSTLERKLEYTRRTVGKTIRDAKCGVGGPKFIIRGWPNYRIKFDGNMRRESGRGVYDILLANGKCFWNWN